MDDRLKQVQTTDLTDSRLNHEFVAWLKTSGMNYLLMLLLVACAFLAWDWWNRKQDEAIDTAWTELSSATSPAALRGVADTHASVDGVAELSLLTAGDILLQSARTGLRPGLAAGDEGAELTAEDKTSTLQEADGFFAEAVPARLGPTRVRRQADDDRGAFRKSRGRRKRRPTRRCAEAPRGGGQDLDARVSPVG